MIEIQVEKNTPKKMNGGHKNMKKRQSYPKKLAGKKSRHANTTKIFYKKTSREKVAKGLAEKDLAQHRKIINSFNLPDWVDCDALREVYRKDPILFTE